MPGSMSQADCPVLLGRALALHQNKPAPGTNVPSPVSEEEKYN